MSPTQKVRPTLNPDKLAEHYGFTEHASSTPEAPLDDYRPKLRQLETRPQPARPEKGSVAKKALAMVALGATVSLISVFGERVLHNQEHNPWPSGNTPTHPANQP